MMNWAILASLIFCAATFVTSMSLLIVSSYDMTNTDNRFPLVIIDNWRNYLSHIIPISIVTMLLSTFTCWVVTRPRSGGLAVTIIFLHCCAIVTYIVYINLLCQEINRTETSAAAIKNRTALEFLQHKKSNPTDLKWIPEWLSKIQKQSETCCGIIGYQDYEDFWPENQQEVPTSCCRSGQAKCVTNFAQIEWPDNPTDHIKNDEGCASLINKNAIKQIRDTLKFFIALVALVVGCIFGFSLLYICTFWTKADWTTTPNYFSTFDCTSWAFCRRRRRFRNVDANGNLIVDPNNPLLLNPDDPAVDLNDLSTYSYTYIQQLKQIQQMDTQQGLPNFQPNKVQLNSNSILYPTAGTSIGASNLNTVQQQQQQQQSIPQNNAPPTFTYEVIQTTVDPFFLPPNQTIPVAIASSGNVRVQSSGLQPAPNPINFSDDLERQNLKQLLRFGRRNRRQRRQDTDFDQQQL